MVKLCRNCKWVEIKDGVVTDDAMCYHPSTMIRKPVNLVTGETKPPLPLFARVGRDMEHPCGKAGKLFEART